MSSLTAVPFTVVRLTDRFWAPRQRINRMRAIPANEEQCRKTGRIAAFKLAWKPGDPGEPHIFWDSDVAKWIEAAAYSLQTHPDAALDTRLDAVIADIAAAQQPDGYLQTHFTVVRPQERWKHFNDHELYCMGHMIEAGVAHHAATGKRSLLDVCTRLADCIDRAFGPKPGQRRGYCGHEEIELALIRLARATDERRYLDLAKFMIDQRGTKPHYFEALKQEAPDDGIYRHDFAKSGYAYFQAHAPVREQHRVVGHAVRAMYLYCGMADIADACGDRTLDRALGKLWQHTTSSLMYITGGIGSSRHNEGFTFDRDLPNETAYCETCASVGLILWARRMHLRTGDAHYLDVLERALYNAVLAGMSLDGKRFFYENPLASLGNHHRQDWFGCSCCPPNISRLLGSLGGYVASTGKGLLSLDLYAAGRIDGVVDGVAVRADVATEYPWNGHMAVTLTPAHPLSFRIQLRIPSWCRSWSLKIDGKAARATVRRGFARVTRTWSPGDRIELDLAMPVERVRADPRVRHDAGRVALQRGPLVYCLEGCDNGADLDAVVLPRRARITVREAPRLLGGISTLHASGRREEPFDRNLYRTTPAKLHTVPLTAVPYFAWDNRKPGPMAVWMREG
jgi:uncharacterized protein